MLPWAWLAGHYPTLSGMPFSEGEEGIAEVREQHKYPPSASAVRECSGRGRSGSLTGDNADRDLDNPRNLPTLCAV